MFKSINIVLQAITASIVQLMRMVDGFSAAGAELGESAHVTAKAFRQEVEMEANAKLEELAHTAKVRKIERDKALAITE